MALKNYTSQVPANRSVQLITEMLQKHGANAIYTQFEEGTGRIASLSFQIMLGGQPWGFKLPLKWRETKEVLVKQGIKKAKFDEDYVYRVAWKNIHDWVDIQMCLVELKMVDLAEVFLPYSVQKGGNTLYENILANPQFLLKGGQDN